MLSYILVIFTWLSLARDDPLCQCSAQEGFCHHHKRSRAVRMSLSCGDFMSWDGNVVTMFTCKHSIVVFKSAKASCLALGQEMTLRSVHLFFCPAAAEVTDVQSSWWCQPGTISEPTVSSISISSSLELRSSDLICWHSDAYLCFHLDKVTAQTAVELFCVIRA